MTQDIHALSGAYAVDAVDDRERHLFEEHLSVCSACQAEVASLRETAAVLATSTVSTPSLALRSRVLEQISQVRPLPPEQVVDSGVSDISSETRATARSRRESATVTSLADRRRPVRWLVAAAAAAAVVLGGTAVWQPWDQGTNQTQVAADVRQASDAEHTRVTFDGGGAATVWRSKSLGKAVIVTEDMPAAPDGKVYQAWLMNDGQFTSAGIMPSSGSQSVILDGDAVDASAAGITVEPAGGSKAPTSDPIALVNFTA